MNPQEIHAKFYPSMSKWNHPFESRMDRWNSTPRDQNRSRFFATLNRGSHSSWMTESYQQSSPLQRYSSACDSSQSRDLLGPSFWKNSEVDQQPHSSSLFSRDWAHSNEDMESFEDGSGDSKPTPLKTLLESRPIIPNSSNYAVLKISNILWDTTHQEIREFFEPHSIPRHHLPPYYMEGIHLILNRQNGRTLHECFIELPDMDVARDILQDKIRKRQLLGGKMVRIELSSQRELRMALFPRFTIQRGNIGIQQGAVYLQKEEISFLLQQCRSMRYQSPKRSKALERPFENVISIISKIPWYDADSLSTLFRDHVFEMLKRNQF
jgi:hypothetical protein